jgi:hypothetical protein
MKTYEEKGSLESSFHSICDVWLITEAHSSGSVSNIQNHGSRKSGCRMLCGLVATGE